jgi:hypothetical protein
MFQFLSQKEDCQLMRIQAVLGLSLPIFFVRLLKPWQSEEMRIQAILGLY